MLTNIIYCNGYSLWYKGNSYYNRYISKLVHWFGHLVCWNIFTFYIIFYIDLELFPVKRVLGGILVGFYIVSNWPISVLSHVDSIKYQGSKRQISVRPRLSLKFKILKFFLSLDYYYSLTVGQYFDLPSFQRDHEHLKIWRIKFSSGFKNTKYFVSWQRAVTPLPITTDVIEFNNCFP